MARQYFNSQLADSSIVAASITPGTTKTFLFTAARANQFFPLPAGLGVSAPFAGQIFRFAAGGLITTPATGTLIIEATHGPGSSSTAGGTGLGPSPAQTVTASLTSIPWRIEGELIYRTIASSSLGSTAWLTGVFMSQGTLATAGGGWVVPFGSTAVLRHWSHDQRAVDLDAVAQLTSIQALNQNCGRSVRECSENSGNEPGFQIGDYRAILKQNRSITRNGLHLANEFHIVDQ
jgi:hypothetical protein